MIKFKTVSNARNGVCEDLLKDSGQMMILSVF